MSEKQTKNGLTEPQLAAIAVPSIHGPPESCRGSWGQPMSAAAHQGWCLKKAKSQSPWDRTHNSLRYFVSRGHALSYFEGDPNRKQAVVRGVIDLRQVKRVRPSVDKSAPELAIDMVVSAGRTYVIVPQPATAEERAKWISVWMVQLQGEGVIAPELRAEAGALLGQGARTTADQPPPALAVASSNFSKPIH